MYPERYEEVGDKRIEEFYWNGKPVVYVNNFLSLKTFEEEFANAGKGE